mgnify:CR=1 FL=1
MRVTDSSPRGGLAIPRRGEARGPVERLLRAANRPVDAASLGAFRLLFGAMMAFGLARFVAQGWVDKVLVEPTFFFKFPGLSWTWVGPPPLLYLHFGITAAAAIALGLGWRRRLGAVVFFVGFTYLQLLDVTLYLNHYYLVVLLAGFLVLLPAERALSVVNPTGPATVPAWCIHLLRFQVAVVYVFAAVAKLHPDWLRYGQPLGMWMRARTELPLVGPLLDEPWLPLAMSWAGFLYDATIWIFLLVPSTRALAYAAVLVFHFFTALFFEIGMFPVIMVVATTVFFAPDWPRRWIPGLASGRPGERPAVGRGPEAVASPAPEPAALGRPRLALLAAYVALQVALPLRHFALPGDVLWNERGMRFSWKVMVREKNGDIRYWVRLPSGREREVSALDYLTWRQYSDMSGQPDLIHQLGRHIGWDFEKRGEGPVEVRVDAWVSLNGRAPARLVDPDVDITRLSSPYDPRWLRPAPAGPPLTQRPARAQASP